MKGGLEKKMLGEHLSVSCVPIIQRAVVPVPILQPGWKPLQSFPSRLFFCPSLNMIRLIEFFLTLSLKFVTVLLSIPFPRYVKLLSIQCFPIDIEYKVKPPLLKRSFFVKTGFCKYIEMRLKSFAHLCAHLWSQGLLYVTKQNQQHNNYTTLRTHSIEQDTASQHRNW